MMADSAETRKAERRPVLDVALPMRRPARDAATIAAEDGSSDAFAAAPNTTKFSLLSKRGNKPQVSRGCPSLWSVILLRGCLQERPRPQQTRDLDLPSDSAFAVAHRTRREAEQAEKQAIKKLVLNYDLRSDDGVAGGGGANADGDSPSSPSPSQPLSPSSPDGALAPNPNHARPLPLQSRSNKAAVVGNRAETRRRRAPRHAGPFEKPPGQPPAAHGQSKDGSGGGATGPGAKDAGSAGDKTAGGPQQQQQQQQQGGQRPAWKRQGQQARKLQMSDVDW